MDTRQTDVLAGFVPIPARGHTTDFSIVLIGGLVAASLPYGYLIALIVGTALFYLARHRLTRLAG